VASRLLATAAICLATALPVASVAADATPPPAPGIARGAAPPSCRSPISDSAHLAIDRWCDGHASVARRYYDWSLARTRRRACADLRSSFASCKAEVRTTDLDGAPGPVVIADATAGEVTYWQARLARRGRGFRVASVDFYEDCTGP
jgi:hypothetical protein